MRNKTTRIVSITLALAGGWATGSVFAASNSAEASAVVIQPIVVTKDRDLSFGNFAPGNTVGSVTVRANNNRVSTGGVVLSSINNSSPRAAKFDVSGTGNATYSIAYTGSSSELTGPGATPAKMNFAICSANTAVDSCADTVSSGTLVSGTQSLFVGGTLTVAPGQAAGLYSGNVVVVVEYN